MPDPSQASMSETVATALQLATIENRNPDRAITHWWSGGPLQDGQYLLFLMMTWHVCTLLEPNLLQHSSLDTCLAKSTRHWPLSSQFSHFQTSSQYPPALSALLQPLETSLQAHPLHVVSVTSSTSRLCEIVLSTTELEATLTRTSYLGYMRDKGGSSEAETHSPWIQDTHDIPLGEFDFVQDRAETFHDTFGGCWNGTWTTGNSPEEEALTALELRPDLDPRRHSPAARFEHEAADLYEAHGVWVIIKALAQQNGGAVLLLRTILCIASLLCFAQSLLVEHFSLDKGRHGNR